MIYICEKDDCLPPEECFLCSMPDEVVLEYIDRFTQRKLQDEKGL